MQGGQTKINPRFCQSRHALKQFIWLVWLHNLYIYFLFPIPETVYLIFSSSHLFIFTFSWSHLLIFTSSLTPSHLHICSSSHPLTPSHLHIFSHTFSSSHLLIFTSSRLHIFSSSHLLIFTSAPLHICSLHTFFHTFSSSHLLIFTPSLTPSHLHTFSHTPHLHIFSLSHSLSSFPLLSLSLLSLSFLSLLSLSPFSPPCLSLAFFVFLSLGRVTKPERAQNQETDLKFRFTCAGATLSYEMSVFRGDLGKNCDLSCPGVNLSHELKFDRRKLRQNCRFHFLGQPFRTIWGSIGINWSKTTILLVPEQPFHTKWLSTGKTWGKIAILHKMMVGPRKLRLNCRFSSPGSNPREIRFDRRKLR